MITAAEGGEYEVGEVVQHIVIWFVESGKVGSVREVSDHTAAEDSHGAESELIRDLILSYEHEAIEWEGLRSVLVELFFEASSCAEGGTVSKTGWRED